MGCPSNPVAIAAGVPGVFTKQAGIASENIAQTYSPPSMAIPSPVGKPKVNGTNNAVPIVAVKPGSVPTTSPNNIPIVIYIKYDGLMAIKKASIIYHTPKHDNYF
jgi:hypothetical protein